MAGSIALYGVGNPLMDLIAHVPAEKVRALDAIPGSMNLVDATFQSRVLEGTEAVYRSPGGSCANTLRGVAYLAGRGGESVAYTGGVGDDAAGHAFADMLTSVGVEPHLAFKGVPTGSSAILVTPDHERTMFTNLSACRELNEADLKVELLETCRVFHTTGYMWDTPNQEAAAMAAVDRARASGARISFDIADPFVADRYRDRLAAWIPGHADLLFANREELASLLQLDVSPQELVEAAEELAPLVALKVGKDGCLIRCEGRTIKIEADPVEPRDTTGAGDAFAAGFLYAILEGRSVEDCGRLANRLAARIVGVEACDYGALGPVSDRNRVI